MVSTYGQWLSRPIENPPIQREHIRVGEGKVEILEGGTDQIHWLNSLRYDILVQVDILVSISAAKLAEVLVDVVHQLPRVIPIFGITTESPQVKIAFSQFWPVKEWGY